MSTGKSRPWGFRLVRPAALVLAGLSLGSAGASAQARGLVVETVAPRGTAAAAGLQSADRLFAWTAPDGPGEPAPAPLETVFDWARVEIEGAQTGRVAVTGERRGAPAEWTLEKGQPGLTVRPDLDGDSAAAWEAARSSSDPAAGAAAAAVLAASLRAGGLTSHSCWAYLQAARLSGDVRRWDEADGYLGLAEATAGEDPSAVVCVGLEKAALLRKRGDLKGAESASLKAAETCRAAWGETLWFAECTQMSAATAFARRDLDAAEPLYAKALEVRSRLAPGGSGEAESLNGLGGVAFFRGDLETAGERYRKTLAIYDALDPGGVGASKVLSNLGSVFRNLGDLREAQGYCERALSIQRASGLGGAALANTLNNLGLIAHQRGDLEAADAYHREALAIRESLGPESAPVAASLNNLGGVAEARGDMVLAESCYRRAVAVMEKLAPDSLDLAACQSNLGAVLGARGDSAGALACHRKALAIEEKVAPDSANVAGSLFNLGLEAKRGGDSSSALLQWEKAKAVFEKAAPGSLGLAGVLYEMGLLRLASGDVDAAGPLLEEALAIRARLAPGSLPQAEACSALSRFWAVRGDGAKALEMSLAAVEALESQMGRLGGVQDVKAEYRSAAVGLFRDAVDKLVRAGRPEDAFALLERSRSRAFLEMLGERDVDLAGDLPPNLRVTYRKLQREADGLMEELASSDPAGDPDGIRRAQERLAEVRAKRAGLADAVRRASPRMAGVQYPRPLDLDGVRRGLDPGTVMLAYSVGRDRSYLFAVTGKGSFRCVALPVGERALRERVEAYRGTILSRRTPGLGAAQATAQGRDLYDLLVAPAGSLIDPSGRILVVPDGPLHLLPFGALVRPGKGRSPVYLAQYRPIHVTSSATAFVEMAARAGARGAGVGPNLVAFSASGPAGPKGREAGAESALPAAGREVASIARLFPSARVYTGKDASEANAVKAAAGADVIHFACHARVDASMALNSGLILGGGRGSEDEEVLTAWEVLESLRTPAGLVVLSACETGLGREVAGEGLVGLVRAFHYAGAPSVVASLWRVEDASTAFLMESFYGHIKAGFSADVALQKAQEDVISSRGGQGLPPFYWAGFQLYGDWK